MARSGKSSSPARSPARSIRRPCRRICRSPPRRSPTRRSPRPRRVPRSCISMPAIPRRASPTRRPRPSRRFLPRIKQGTNAVINITTGGSPYMKVEERDPAGGGLQARGRLPQHGLDEFRPVPDAGEIQGLQIRLGAARISRTPATCVFRNTFKDIEYILDDLRGQRHALRVRML